MIVRMIRWILGYVRFSIRGGSEERFLNQCARRGAYLWNISAGDKAGACIAAGRYRYLRPCARKAGCRLKIGSRKGLPFLTMRFRKRPGLWAGAAVFLVTIRLLSLHVWTVRIVGNTSIPTSAVESALADEGLCPGAWKSGIDPQNLEERLMLKFPKIGWVSVNTLGCVTEVALQEKTDCPEIVEQDRICNIKASATGQILSMKVYAGTPLVKKGDAVVEGQLLVSAVVEDESGVGTLKHASATILAETTHTFSAQIPMKKQEWQPTGVTVTRRSLSLFGAKFPLTFIGKPKGEYEAKAVKTDVSLFGTVLPVSVYEEIWTQVNSCEITLTRRQALDAAKKQIEDSAKAELSEAKMISSSYSDKVDNGNLICGATVTCEEDIAKEAEILIE